MKKFDFLFREERKNLFYTNRIFSEKERFTWCCSRVDYTFFDVSSATYFAQECVCVYFITKNIIINNNYKLYNWDYDVYIHVTFCVRFFMVIHVYEMAI